VQRADFGFRGHSCGLLDANRAAQGIFTIAHRSSLSHRRQAAEGRQS
jgi:hypothetical protein